jgi:rhodanese-related sulfurtransferase
MIKLLKSVAALITAMGLVFGLTACAPEATDMSKVTAVIDVRTPAEFAEGHLEGALNIDVQGMDFATEVQKLDVAGTYVVYCRSGNRSTAAIEQMTGMGFTNLTNGGSVANASAITGLAIVQ